MRKQWHCGDRHVNHIGTLTGGFESHVELRTLVWMTELQEASTDSSSQENTIDPSGLRTHPFSMLHTLGGSFSPGRNALVLT